MTQGRSRLRDAMKTSRVPLALLALALCVVVDTGAQNPNPIRLEGQIREIAYEYEGVTLRLHRDRYPIHLSEATHVRWLDGRRATANELMKGDSIRVAGDLEKNVIHAQRVTSLRLDDRPGRGRGSDPGWDNFRDCPLP